MIEIHPFRQEHIAEAAYMFSRDFRKQREAVPALPARMEYPQETESYLANLLDTGGGCALIADGSLTGYLCWFIVHDFRNTGRIAAYVPVWGHSALPSSLAKTYQRLYNAASMTWFEKGCQVQAVSFLPVNAEVEKFWFWNGFGLLVVDAAREIPGQPVIPGAGFTYRKAAVQDAALLQTLEQEHFCHYSLPPTLMIPDRARTEDEFASLVDTPPASAWLAFKGDRPAGYMVFERSTFGATIIVRSETTIANTSVYTRAEFRGQGTAAGILDAALRYYAGSGFTCCSVDFESVNPNASSFWLRYFQPVCLSAVRVPERQPPLPPE